MGYGAARHDRPAVGLLALAVVMAVLVAPAAVDAQETEEGGSAGVADPDPIGGHDEALRFLLRAGGSWADLRGRVEFPTIGAVAFEGDFGFAVGVGLEWLVSDRLSIQPELLIVRRFSRAEVGGDEGPESKLSSHYAEVPLYLKWYPGGRTGGRANVVVGAVPGLLLGATREIRDDDRIEDAPARSLLADIDWSLGVGGGFEFSEAFANFTVDLRYVHGLTDMNSSESPVTARWSTVQLIVGIAF